MYNFVKWDKNMVWMWMSKNLGYCYEVFIDYNDFFYVEFKYGFGFGGFDCLDIVEFYKMVMV